VEKVILSNTFLAEYSFLRFPYSISYSFGHFLKTSDYNYPTYATA
jgi:hypothetical protein